MVKKAHFSQKRVFLKITQVRISGTEMMKFGPGVPLYSIQKSLEQIFEISLFFGNMSKIVDKISKMSKILDITSHISKTKSKIQKSVPSFFRYHIKVPQDKISAS